MGTFAEIFKETESIIPENKKDEFIKKIEKIFQAGGMMEIECIQLYGKKVYMLRKVRMKEDGMEFHYNYFEDDFWENAGFNKKECYVWSNKIGWSHFYTAVVAAYVLEEQYTDGFAVALVNNVPVTSYGYVGWMNYLFNEQKHVKNFDLWKLFETIHYSNKKVAEYMQWYDFGKTGYGFISGCEIYAVLYGYKEAIAVYNAKEKGKAEELVLNAIQCAVELLNEYKNNSKKDKESQLQILIEMFLTYYGTDEETKISLYSKEEKLQPISTALSTSDAPAFVIKVISEIYEVDFWDLWDKVRNVTKRELIDLYGNDGYYIVPIPTEKFFRQSPDDMLPYWEEASDIEFSKELQEWFRTLKVEYHHLLEIEFDCDNVLKYIVDLLEEVNENYYHIFAFSDFFEETLKNLHDKRYQTLWRLFDNMIHHPEMKKAGDVIFVPDGSEHENEGLHYFGEQSKRRLISSWDILSKSKRQNKARLTFRRYMALLGNKDLRCKVFGF